MSCMPIFVFPIFDLFQAGFPLGLLPLVCGLLIDPVHQSVWETLQGGELVRGIMGVLIAFAVV